MAKLNATKLRAYFTEQGKSIAMTDEILVASIEKFGAKKFDDLDYAQQLAFIENAEKEVAKVSIADPAISALAAKVNDDDEFNAEIETCIAAVIKGKTTALDILGHLRRVFTRNELNSMPWPGTTEKTVKGNDKPDVVETTTANGTAIRKVWCNDFVSALGWGKDFETALDNASKEIKTAGAVPALAGKGKKELAAMKSTANQKRNALRSMFKRALETDKQLMAVENMPDVVCEFIPGTKSAHIKIPAECGTGKFGKTINNGEGVTLAPKPFWVYPKGKPSDGRDFSVTQLLGFDVDAAIALGGTMANLVTTAERGAGDGAEGEGDGVDMSIEQATAGLSMQVNFFNKRDNLANVNRVLVDKKNEDRADLLENIGDLYLLIAPIYRKNKAEYETIKGIANATEEKEEATG